MRSVSVSSSADASVLLVLLVAGLPGVLLQVRYRWVGHRLEPGPGKQKGRRGNPAAFRRLFFA